MNPPRITTRAEWEPRHGIGHPTPGPQSRVVVHHAPERTIPDNPTREQIAEQIRIMEDWHADTLTPTHKRIGYHFIAIEQTGEIWEGLGWDRIGAHVGGHNTASLGVLILGINGAESAGSDRTWRAIGGLVTEGIRRGSLIARPELSPHRRYRATSCPGDVLTRHVEQLALEELLALVDLPEPVVELVGTDWTPPPLETLQPVEALRSPARAMVEATAEPDEPLRDWLCRITGWVMDEQALTARLPWWLPPSLARRALSHVFGCP